MIARWLETCCSSARELTKLPETACFRELAPTRLEMKPVFWRDFVNVSPASGQPLDKSRQASFRDGDADDSVLLFLGYLWLLVGEIGDAKLVGEVVLGPSTRVVGRWSLFCHQWRSVVGRGTEETSAAVRFVLDRVEATEK